MFGIYSLENNINWERERRQKKYKNIFEKQSYTNILHNTYPRPIYIRMAFIFLKGKIFVRVDLKLLIEARHHIIIDFGSNELNACSSLKNEKERKITLTQKCKQNKQQARWVECGSGSGSKKKHHRWWLEQNCLSMLFNWLYWKCFCIVS